MKTKLLVILSAALLLVGCATTTPPTATEGKFFDITTNLVDRIVVKTNLVELYRTNYQTVVLTFTNIQNQLVPIYYTNTTTMPVYATNFTTVTNLAEAYDYKPNANAAAVGGIATTVAGPFGTVAGLVIAGIFGIWGRIRSTRDSKTMGVLTQSIETARNLLRQSPQGQQLDQQFVSWLVSNQAKTETITKIAELVKNTVSKPEAQFVAAEILKYIEESKPKTP